MRGRGRAGGASGARSNMYSNSKFSNWSRFNPWDMEIDSALKRWPRPAIRKGIIKLPTRSDFLMPLEPEDVLSVFQSLGEEKTADIDTVLLLGGTKRQAAFGRGARFGVYCPSQRLIAIHAFPKSLQTMRFKNGLSPAQMQIWVRAGGELRSPNTVFLDEAAVKRFLRDDVLLHEIGHHVDRQNLGRKANRKVEGFAEWFATEHGFNQVSKPLVVKRDR